MSTFAASDDTEKRDRVKNDRYNKDKNYPESVREYLEPTCLTNSNHPEIVNVADSILNLQDSLTIHVIINALKYSSKRIQYDNELAIN